MLFDNGRQQLICEFKPNVSAWAELPRGQRLAYTNLVRSGRGDVGAALVRHRADVDVVDTLHDVVSFQVMHLKDGKVEVLEVRPAEDWLPYVKRFFGIDTA